jgi:DNA-binding NarL/FixJ family response regulator
MALTKLDSKEQLIVDMLALGYTIRSIAVHEQIMLHENTVKWHLRKMQNRYQCNTLYGLLVFLTYHGLLSQYIIDRVAIKR